MDKGFVVALERLLDNCYPERQFILRSRGEVGFVTLGQKSQIVLSLGGLLFLGWLAYASVGAYLQLDIIAGKNAQIAGMVGVHDRLNADMRAVESRYRQITLDLEDNQKVLGDILLQRASLDRKRAELLRELNKTRKQRDLAYNRGAKLQVRLAKLEGSLHRTLDESSDLQSHLSQITNRLATTENDRDREQRERLTLSLNLNTLQQNLSGLEVELESSEQMVARLTNQRDQAFSANRSLASRIGDLEGRLQQLRLDQRTLVENIHDRTDANIVELETVVELTGLNINSLLDRVVHGKIGIGGPLLASEEARTHAGEYTLKKSSPLHKSLGLLENRLSRWTALNSVLERLPITPPVDNFSISSGFGKRRDPFTKRKAFHSGLDLAGVRRTRVYATSLGTVTYVGWKGPYGRLVEIDHGLGLKTRYGHLRKILVKKGQKVDFRQKIGLMGSSGRSTGTHVHYEVVFDGKPVNPKKFLKAGKYVFKG